MRTNGDVLPPTVALPSSTTLKKENSDAHPGFFGRTRPYKFWVLAAILLLAFWSLFTGSVTLKSSSGNLTRFSGRTHSLIGDDLDILEVEEREKVVRHMWDVYTQSKSNRLPKFWQKAFEAAYEHLVSDIPGVRDSAVSEIAKMSIRTIALDPLPAQSQSTGVSRKSPKQTGKVKAITVGGSR